MGVVRAVLAVATMLAFVALVVHVWNRKYQRQFEQVARMAIDEDLSASSDPREPT